MKPLISGKIDTELAAPERVRFGANGTSMAHRPYSRASGRRSRPSRDTVIRSDQPRWLLCQTRDLIGVLAGFLAGFLAARPTTLWSAVEAVTVTGA